MVDAIVLAGGEIEADRFPGLDTGIARKAQIPLLGQPMIEWVVRGLRACPRIGRMVVVGHERLNTPAPRALGAVVTPEAGDIAGNLRAGLDALFGSRLAATPTLRVGTRSQPDPTVPAGSCEPRAVSREPPVSGPQRALALSSDLALLTPAALDDLVANAPDAGIVFPYVERADILREFPDRVWVFSRTPEGAFTGCSAALFRPAVLLANWPWVESMLNARRRSPLGLALLIGPAFALQYLLGRLRVADVGKKLSALLRLVGRGYQSRYSELAMDIDKYSDIALVENVLRQREACHAGQ